MTGCNKVFLDTAPLIYFLDNDERFGQKVQSILEEILTSGNAIVTSAVTCMEYLVYPYRTRNRQKIDVFFEFIEDCDIPLIPVDAKIAQRAAQIRAEYASFKSMDSLQLATAVCSGCDTFLTNDKQLKQFGEINCVTVEDWVLN